MSITIATAIIPYMASASTRIGFATELLLNIVAYCYPTTVRSIVAVYNQAAAKEAGILGIFIA